MKKNLLLGAFMISSLFTAKAQTVLFEDSFESYENFIIDGIGDWITIDIDQSSTYTGGGGTPWANANLPQAYIIFNPSAAGVQNADSGNEIRNFDPRTGQKYAASWAAVLPGDGEGGSGPNNDWLVSPEVTLEDENNIVSFWVKSMSSSYGLEQYNVGIYTGSGTPSQTSDFTIISDPVMTAPFPQWQQVSFNLDDYAGQTIRVGIHCISNNAYMFMVDDFMITAGELSTKNHLASQFSVYPNPARDVINISNSDNILINNIKIMDINGRTIKSLQLNDVTDAQINVSDLSNGVYIMNISSDKGSTTKKIVKN